MKVLLGASVLSLLAVACTPVSEFQAGGAAFDDSALGPALDSGAGVPGVDPGTDRYDAYNDTERSYEQWRNEE